MALMVDYNFDKITDRKNTNSVKYDFAEKRGIPAGAMPMWIADMDFPAPPKVLEDIHRAVAHGIFGYSEAQDGYYEAVINWFSTRFGFEFVSDDVVKTPGIVFALAQGICAFTNPGEAVLIQPPVYHPFYAVVNNGGRRLVTNPLIYENGTYSIDFEDFERKITQENVKLFILCSPHNPVGRVWKRSELEKLNEICTAHGVVVISDEIHCDFVHPGHTHICFGTINDRAIVATAPSKTFNIAGLQTSNIIVKDEEMRNKLKAEIAKTGGGELNTLGLVACQSAYTKGGAWLAQLNEYLMQNIRFTQSFLAERLPRIRLAAPEGTYLLWMDFNAYNLPHDELNHRLLHGAGLWFNSGTMFGAEGNGFWRINIGCPNSVLKEALLRLEKEFGSLG